MDQSQNSFRKTLILGPVCVLILYSKIAMWERKASKILQKCSGGQQVKDNGPLIQQFLRVLLFQVGNEIMLGKQAVQVAL